VTAWPQKPDRSNNKIQMITASVIAATTRRVVQLMPRLTHQSSAQLISTGMRVSSRNLASVFGLADKLDAERLSATPDDFAISSRSCITRERQPQVAG
jgi:hypothetical protein